jgi:hypothetical protein
VAHVYLSVTVTSDQIPYLLQIIAIISFCLAVCTSFLFYDKPPRPPSYTAWMRTLEVERDKALKMAADHMRQQQQSLRRQSTLSRFGEPLPEAPVTGEVVTHDYAPVGAAGTNPATAGAA